MLRFSKALPFLSLAAIVGLGIQMPVFAQTTPEQEDEGTMAAVPIDLEFNANGSKVVVRGVDLEPSYSSTDVITIWDSSNDPVWSGKKLFGSSLGGSFCGAAYPALAPEGFSSDTVRVVGNTAVLIADNGENHDRILIDVVDLGLSPGCLANFAKPDVINSLYEGAGQAHDVEITPDGTYAVVNCKNWIFIVDLSTSPPGVVVEYNTASPSNYPSWALGAPTQTGTTEFWSSVDSVALTDYRGIVVQGAWEILSAGFYPIVYLIDFVSTDPPSITQIDMKQTLLAVLGEEHGFFDPHDVAIVPIGDLAVATYDNAVSLFDLATLTHVTSPLDPVARRYPLQVDSVELTDTHAVVIGGSASTSIKVFDLRAGLPTGSPGLSQTFSTSFPNDMGAHDLALFDRLSESLPEAAVIKAGEGAFSGQGEVYVLRNFTSTPTLTPVGSHGSPVTNANGIPRVSDSIVAASFREGGQTKRYGVSIGVQDPLTQPKRAWIDVVDVDSPAPYTTYGFTIGSATDDTIPTDLAFAVSTSRVFVRCQAPPDEDPPAITGRDIAVVRLDGTPFLEVGNPLPLPQIGGSGLMDNRNQADTMIVQRRRAVSISEDLSDPQSPAGFVHTTKND